jgi:hypothetical protein
MHLRYTLPWAIMETFLLQYNKEVNLSKRCPIAKVIILLFRLVLFQDCY